MYLKIRRGSSTRGGHSDCGLGEVLTISHSNNSRSYEIFTRPQTWSRRMRWAVYVVHVGHKRGECRSLVGRPDGKRPLGRPRRRWG